MNQEFQLQLQAYLDGELPDQEVGALEARLQQDPSARRLMDELHQTRSLCAGNEMVRAIPESREFYWSKIRQQIEREAAQPVRTLERPTGWRRWLKSAFVPVGGLAVAVAAMLSAIIWLQPPQSGPKNSTDFEQMMTMTFHDQEEGITVVWLSYNE